MSDPGEERDIDDSDVHEGECETCGEVRPVKLLSDPFLFEICDETDEPRWWCAPCFGLRVGDL